MRKWQFILVGALMAVGLVGVVGCGGGGGPSLVSISITPNGLTLQVAGTQQFTCTANYSDGSTQEVAATWTLLQRRSVA